MRLYTLVSAPENPAPMTPGGYLMLRREAARLSLNSLAQELSLLPFVASVTRAGDMTRLKMRLWAAENSDDHLTAAQIATLESVVRLDPEIYAQLVDLRSAQKAGDFATLADLPVPHLCRRCACSWHDACRTAEGPCAWSEREANLCTACEAAEARSLSPDRPFGTGFYPNGPLGPQPDIVIGQPSEGTV